MCVTKGREVSYILWIEAKYHFVKHQKYFFLSLNMRNPDCSKLFWWLFPWIPPVMILAVFKCRIMTITIMKIKVRNKKDSYLLILLVLSILSLLYTYCI